MPGPTLQLCRWKQMPGTVTFLWIFWCLQEEKTVLQEILSHVTWLSSNAAHLDHLLQVIIFRAQGEWKICKNWPKTPIQESGSLSLSLSQMLCNKPQVRLQKLDGIHPNIRLFYENKPENTQMWYSKIQPPLFLIQGTAIKTTVCDGSLRYYTSTSDQR